MKKENRTKKVLSVYTPVVTPEKEVYKEPIKNLPPENPRQKSAFRSFRETKKETHGYSSISLRTISLSPEPKTETQDPKKPFAVMHYKPGFARSKVFRIRKKPTQIKKVSNESNSPSKDIDYILRLSPRITRVLTPNPRKDFITKKITSDSPHKNKFWNCNPKVITKSPTHQRKQKIRSYCSERRITQANFKTLFNKASGPNIQQATPNHLKYLKILEDKFKNS